MPSQPAGNTVYRTGYMIDDYLGATSKSALPVKRIYMDHAATTPLDQRVLDAMLPFLRDGWGNPSAVYERGRLARHAVEEARDTVASLIGAEPAEIVFTSGGTESNNLAIRAGARHASGIYCTRAEHDAVLRPVERLGKRAVCHWCPVDEYGVPDDTARQMIAEASADSFVTCMLVNNETGSLTDVAGIAASTNATVHTDAIQAMGLLPVDVDNLSVDLMSLSAHKFCGPKGVGCLYVRSGVDLDPLIVGGGQERERRGGTENVAGIVGLAEALRIAVDEQATRAAEVSRLTARLRSALAETVGEFVTVVTPAKSAPHILTVVVGADGAPTIDGEMLLLNLDVAGLEVSSGAACSSGSVKPSHVLLAAGWPVGAARTAIRFSLGHGNTEQDVDRAAEIFAGVIRRMISRRTGPKAIMR